MSSNDHVGLTVGFPSVSCKSSVKSLTPSLLFGDRGPHNEEVRSEGEVVGPAIPNAGGRARSVDASAPRLGGYTVVPLIQLPSVTTRK